MFRSFCWLLRNGDKPFCTDTIFGVFQTKGYALLL
jgi:hypothetical protein